jgi:hypothetical protein
MVKRDGAAGRSLSNIRVVFLLNNSTCFMSRGKNVETAYSVNDEANRAAVSNTLSQFEAQQTLTKINQ